MAVLEGYYIGETNLYAYIKKTMLDAVTEDIDGSDNNNIQQAIINRCGYVNTKLSNKYEVPLAEAYQTDALKAAISHLVILDVLGNYESVSEQELDIRKYNAKSAETFLNDLRDGKQDLITELNDDGEKTERYYFSSDKRINRDFY